MPYPLVILHHLKKWREEHDGQAPSTSDEKRAFRERLRREARQPTQQNIEEAVSAANTALLKPRVRMLFIIGHARGARRNQHVYSELSPSRQLSSTPAPPPLPCPLSDSRHGRGDSERSTGAFRQPRG